MNRLNLPLVFLITSFFVGSNFLNNYSMSQNYPEPQKIRFIKHEDVWETISFNELLQLSPSKAVLLAYDFEDGQYYLYNTKNKSELEKHDNCYLVFF